MNQLVDSDSLIMRLPVPLRLVVATIAFLLVVAANANLAYLMAHPSTAPLPSPTAKSEQAVVTQALEDEDGVVALCDLRDVVCPGDMDIAPPVVVKTPPRLEGAPVKKGASKEMQEMVDYAWKLSKDLDFILTIEAESGFNPKAVNKNRDGSIDSGIAQINHYWHKHIVRDPKYQDWKFQLEQGWKLYKGGTRFYGYDVRHRVQNRFVMK